MQKKIIALAVAGLASTAALAQSNVTVYGRVDLGAVYQDGNSGGVNGTEGRYQMASGVQGGSRIGFKGVEDLGNGLKALFELEYGITVDQNKANGIGGNRHSYVGLTGGFGTVVAGKLDGVRYGIFNTYDPFAGGTVANFTQMTAQVDRADNAIAYISPKFSGFGLVLAYATDIGTSTTPAGDATVGESDGNNQDATLQTIMATYDNGPITARLDYEQVVYTQDAAYGATLASLSNGDKFWVATAGASYDFGVVKLSALIDVAKKGDLFKEQAWLIGAKAPVGKFDLKAMIGGVKDKVNDDADSIKWGLGLDYNLSKRTNLYANYGGIKNDDGASRSINQGANGYGSLGTGYGTTGFDLGIAHKF